jgi:hypothetical protein
MTVADVRDALARWYVTEQPAEEERALRSVATVVVVLDAVDTLAEHTPVIYHCGDTGCCALLACVTCTAEYEAFTGRPGEIPWPCPPWADATGGQQMVCLTCNTPIWPGRHSTPYPAGRTHAECPAPTPEPDAPKEGNDPG